MSSLAKFLVKRDIFGQPIAVLYKGSDNYRTKLGGICTILSAVLILINTVILIQGFFNGNRQSESSSSLTFDNFHAGKFYLTENNVQLSFSTLVPIPENIGRLEVRNKRKKGNDQDWETFIPALERCDAEYYN